MVVDKIQFGINFTPGNGNGTGTAKIPQRPNNGNGQNRVTPGTGTGTAKIPPPVGHCLVSIYRNAFFVFYFVFLLLFLICVS